MIKEKDLSSSVTLGLSHHLWQTEQWVPKDVNVLIPRTSEYYGV